MLEEVRSLHSSDIKVLKNCSTETLRNTKEATDIKGTFKLKSQRNKQTNNKLHD